MPRTIRNEYYKKLSYESLMQAHLESRKGKSTRKEIIQFNLKQEEYIMWLYEQLKTQKYKHSGYTSFYVTEPKLRKIEKSVYMDRIVHRWYVDNFLKEYFVKLIKHELLFQEFLAVRDASFTIRKGEAWALVGSNGSGKSTLLKAISGILKPYKGEIVVNGTISPLLELGAGFDMNLTARENIFLNGTVLGHSKKYMQEHFDEIVEFSELHKFLDSPVKNFSSGMRARLGFSIATIVRPDILIVDEILAVGDYSFQQKCLKRMDEMMGGGTTLLFVSHSIDQVRKLCDHAVWINKGQIMQIGEVNEVCDAYMATQKK